MNYSNLPGFMKYYQCVRDHYPLGISPRSYWYFATKETKLLYEKIANWAATKQHNILQNLQQQLSDWEDFSKVELIKDPASPGLGLKAQLYQNNFDSLSEIYFFISLLGPFYCYFGKETDNAEWGYKNISVIVTSPEQHYKPIFQKLEIALTEINPTFSFVPFRFLIQSLEGLFGPYSEGEESHSMCLFQAFFHNDDIREYMDFGDLGYQREWWAASSSYYELKEKFNKLRSEGGFNL